MATKSIGSMPYSLALRPSIPGDKTSEKKIYGQIQQRETIGLRTLATHIHEHGSSFSVGTLQGVLADMVECTRELLKQGYSVDFEGLMRLYVTVNSQGVDEVGDFNPSVHFTRINLRGDVDDDVQNFLNSTPEFEYVMTREEQAAAKKAAKASLTVEGTGDGGDNGGGGLTPDPGTGGGGETPDPGTGGETGSMTITQVNGVNKSNGGNTAIAPGTALTITGTDMTGTWKLDGNVDPSSATATEVVFASSNFAEEGNHTVSFNGSNVFTVSVVEDQ